MHGTSFLDCACERAAWFGLIILSSVLECPRATEAYWSWLFMWQCSWSKAFFFPFMSAQLYQAPVFMTSAIINDSKGFDTNAPKHKHVWLLEQTSCLDWPGCSGLKPVILVLYEGNVILAHIFHSRFRIKMFPPLCSIPLYATEREGHARRTCF